MSVHFSRRQAQLRILLLTHTFGTHAQRWLYGLRDRGHQVKMLVRQAAPDPDVYGPPAWASRIGALRQAYLGAALTRLLNTFRPQIIHQHWFEVRKLFKLLPPEARLVVSAWGSDILLRDWAPDELAAARQFAGRADALLASSHFLADATARVTGRPVETIYWGVNLQRFAPQPHPLRAGYVIGFMKHLEFKYAPDVAVEAFAKVRAVIPQAELRLYGDGPLGEELRAQATRLGVNDAVRIYGPIPYAEVPRAIADFDVMVMPSRTESLGVAAIEGQAMGIPVVASAVGGIPEVVKDGVGGLLVPPDNVDALADALIRLGQDETLRARLGAGGQAYAREHFDWERTLDATEAVYARVLTAERDVVHV